MLSRSEVICIGYVLQSLVLRSRWLTQMCCCKASFCTPFITTAELFHSTTSTVVDRAYIPSINCTIIVVVRCCCVRMRLHLRACTPQAVKVIIAFWLNLQDRASHQGAKGMKYYMPTTMDQGVVNLRQWLKKIAGPVPWGVQGIPDIWARDHSRRETLDRYNQHTKHCKHCSKVMPFFVL